MDGSWLNDAITRGRQAGGLHLPAPWGSCVAIGERSLAPLMNRHERRKLANRDPEPEARIRDGNRKRRATRD